MNLRRNIRNTIEKLRLHLEDLEFQTALLQSKSDYDDEFHKSPCKIPELVLQAYHLLPQQCLEAMEEEEEDDRKELSEYNHDGVFLLINSICSLPSCPPNVNIQLLPHGTNEVSINLPDFGASMSICDERKLAYSIMLFSEEKVWNVLGSGLHPADFEKDRKLICQALDRNFQRATLSPRRKEVTFGKFVDEVK